MYQARSVEGVTTARLKLDAPYAYHSQTPVGHVTAGVALNTTGYMRECV